MEKERQIFLMDPGWKFYLGDYIDNVEHGYLYTYMSTKTESGRGPACADFDDSSWDVVNLPHDYVVCGKPDPKANTVHGSLKRENAWYRKTFALDERDCDKRITIVFEGVCTSCTIWVNGCLMKRNFSAYNEFEIDITDIALYGDRLNVISVYVDTTNFEGWWYEGGGIYRHVWLKKTDRTCIDLWGVWVNPIYQEEQCWEVCVETTVRNEHYRSDDIVLVSQVIDAGGEVKAEMETPFTVSPKETAIQIQSLSMLAPELWSPDHPNLYTLHSVLKRNGKVIDEEDTVFGFRRIRFDKDEGLLLNGEPFKIYGMCLHEDHGGLGVALPDQVKEYRVQRLKEMGANGYRFSHNPHSRQTLDYCDRLGIIVMDENRWFDSSEQGIKQVESMVKRDRNHPCVFMWSMGNEEPLQCTERGKRIMHTLSEHVHRLDTSRPVMMSMHTGLLKDGAGESSDIVGMNYNIELVEEVHKKYPEKTIVFSEISNVGEDDVLGNRQNGISAWKITDQTPYLCGMFAWTGMDYRGEHQYPNLFAPAGVMDQNGYPKDSYYLYQAYWRKEPMLHIQPHWNQAGQEGKNVTVRVFTNGDTVSLYLNENLLGVQEVDPYQQTNWEVKYEPGILKAVATKEGKEWCTNCVETTGPATELHIKPEKSSESDIIADAVILTVEAADEKGRKVPDADNEVIVDVLQGARLLVTGNGDVADHADRRKPVCKLYRGNCQLILAPDGSDHSILVKVSANGLKSAELEIELGIKEKRNVILPKQARWISNWQMSEWYNELPGFSLKEHIEQAAGFHNVEVGHGTQTTDISKKSGHFVYHASSRQPDDFVGKPLRICFEQVEGKAEVLVYAKMPDGKKKEYHVVRDGFIVSDMHVDIDALPMETEIDIWMTLEIHHTFCGILSPVYWQTRS